MTDRMLQIRLWLALGLLFIMMGGLSARLVLLHAGTSGQKRARIEELRRLEKNLTVGRGKILDCQGHVLALDLVRQEVRADPEAIARQDSLNLVARELAELLELEDDVLRARLNRPERRDVTVLGCGKTVDQDVAEALRGWNLPGIFMRENMVRVSLAAPASCHVLGYVNLERQGSAGVEQRWDRYLRGRPGHVDQRNGRPAAGIIRSASLEIRRAPGRTWC